MVKLGDRLSEERRKQGYSIDEIARATKIRNLFLEAIEKGDYKKLPSSAYAQGFIKNYVEFLGLPEKELLALFRREFNEKEFLGVLPQSFTKPKEIVLNGFRLKRAGIIGLIIILFLAFYIFIQYKSAFLSPTLSVASPKEQEIISSQNIVVSGSTEQNSTVAVDNLPALVDNNGNYLKRLMVFPGNITITVKATNNFGKTSTVERHITVK